MLEKNWYKILHFYSVHRHYNLCEMKIHFSLQQYLITLQSYT